MMAEIAKTDKLVICSKEFHMFERLTIKISNQKWYAKFNHVCLPGNKYN